MNLMEKVVTGLGAMLAVCVIVWASARFVTSALPGLVILLGVILTFRLLWRRKGW